MDTLTPLAVFVLAAAVVGSTVTSGRNKPLERRLARLEEKVDRLLKHAGVEAPQGPRMAQLDELLAQGKQIQAIKLYREITGAGLAEAKEAVDRRMR
ncbi:ribosomal protein L7/L12 [Streptomyces sp. CT34]|uniref:ribosomal protein L7/L12 n=1 Tax=Streptomyces sp. CT34 TaxID=1553907 RepID=UPI0005B9E8E3|nr:ribosomal protein L7/L12 [Streptomyces sp. CT34]